MADPAPLVENAAVAVLTVAAVARRMGVAPATLRTWDRRYGLGPSSHTAGAHRRYAPEDLARLGVMRQLTLEGVAPAEAARIALGADVGQDVDASSEATSSWPRPAACRDHGGGRVVALPDCSPAARGLARAAMALDSQACAGLVRRGLEEHGVVATWDGLLVPVLAGIGERWGRTGEGVDVEHLLSECIMAVLRSWTSRSIVPGNARPVLLACAEEEQHGLVLHALAAALADQAVSCRLLGNRVPPDALAAAVRRSGPAAIFVWSQRVATGSGAKLLGLPDLRPRPALVVGGPGWDRETLPKGTRASVSLRDAVEILASATGR